MAYIDQDYMLERMSASELNSLADLDGDGAINAEVITAAVADAQSQIDAKLHAGGFVVPFDPVPVIIQRLCFDKARFLLMGTRASEEARARNISAAQMLEDLCSGAVAIPTIEVTQASGFCNNARDRAFTRATMGDFLNAD